MQRRPGRDESAEYYFTYIDKVPDGDILDVLDAQTPDVLALLEGISEQQSLHRYAPDKWSIREAQNHINDTERLFAFRAFWFARGFDIPLPSFDQNIGVASSGANDVSWASLVEEFRTIRAATMSLFRTLPAAAWDRRGVASGNPFTVRAVAYITAGHVTHHVRVLQERYLT